MPLSQTQSQIETEIANAVAFLHEVRKAAGLNNPSPTSNMVARLETFLESNQGAFSNNAHVEAYRIRNLIAQASSRAAARALLTPLIFNYGKVIGDAPDLSVEGQLLRLRDYFAATATARHIKSRNISYGSPAAGSNIGDGVLNRLTVDRHNFNLENVHIEGKRADCIRDEHTGSSEHEEVFEFLGQELEVDEIAVSNSGLNREIRAASARDSLIANPSFSQRSGTDAVPTELTDWTVNAVGNIQLDSTNYYRDFVGDTTPRSLRIDADEHIRQNYNVRNIRLNPDIPYYCQLAYNRSIGSGDGTLQLVNGSVSASVDLSGASAGWQILRIAIGQNNWPDRFSDIEDPKLEINLTGRTTGYVLVDDVLLVPYDQIDGTWMKLVGGATPFIRDDSFTWTDSLSGGDEGLIQFYLFLAFGGPSFPSKSDGTEEFADPSV